MTNLDNILSATVDSMSGATITREEHNLDNITPGNATFDPAEYTETKAGAVVRANLAMRNGRVSMAYVDGVGNVPWHSLGVGVSKAMNSQEAARLAELSPWRLEKRPLFVEDPVWGRVQSDLFGIFRQDTGQLLGTCKRDYKIVPNEECFEFMDAVIEDGARYETAGALGKGECVWMLARLSDTIEVKGDQVDTYAMFTAYHTGKDADLCYPTTVRAVCQNTHRLSLRDRTKGIRIRHTGDIDQKIADAKQALGLTRKRVQDYAEKANHLASVQVEPQEYFSAVLDDVLAVTIAGQRVTDACVRDGSLLSAIVELQDTESRQTAQKRLDRVLRKRAGLLDDILERYESDRNSGNPAISGTGWAAYNAVSEAVDHGSMYRYQGSPRERAENRMVSLVAGRGDDAKQTAFDLAMQRA